VQALIVFLAVVALSVLASNKRLLEVSHVLHLSQLASSGLVFLLMGMLLGPELVGLLGTSDVDRMAPLVALGLSASGLMIGLNLDPAVLRRLPFRVYAASAVQALWTFGVVTLPAAGALALAQGEAWLQAIGGGVMLGAAASLSSPHVAMIWHRSGRMSRLTQLSISVVAMLDDVVALMLFSGAVVFGTSVSVQAGLAWVTFAAIFGITAGALLSFLLHDTKDPSEGAALAMGGVALVAGGSAYLHLSTLLVAVSCGATMAIIGGRMSQQMFSWLLRFERPIFLGLLFLIGANAKVTNPWAWAMLPFFVLLRAMGKGRGARWATRVGKDTLSLPPRPGYALLAQGGLSLCLAIEYLTLVPGERSETVVTVVALAAVVNEALAARFFEKALQPEDPPEPLTGMTS
jgi:Kef-type K+ transport system membrane component KefB